jgi:hypothetical protein
MHHLTFKPLAIKLAWAIGAGLYVLTTPASLAQTCNATGTCGNVSAPTMTGNFVVPLVNQERETPVVNNNSYVTNNVIQQITQSARPDLVFFYSDYVNQVSDFIHNQGSAPWMINGGFRACQSYGYASGYIVEYYGGHSYASCFRN